VDGVLRQRLADSESATCNGVVRLRLLNAIVGLDGAEAMMMGFGEVVVVKAEDQSLQGMG
jgi:hypothetical protein